MQDNTHYQPIIYTMHYTAISALLKEEFVCSVTHYVDHTIMWLEWGCSYRDKALVYPENGGSKLLRNTGTYISIYIESVSRKLESSSALL